LTTTVLEWSGKWPDERFSLLKEHERKTLFDIPVDEDSLISHYSLSPADFGGANTISSASRSNSA